MSAKGQGGKVGVHHQRGRRQSLTSNRLRKKRDGTPEKSATPSQEPDENLTPSRNVIWNEEIEKLQIKSEELPKVWPPRPPSRERTSVVKRVPVQKVKKDSELDKPKSRMVSVAKPAPPDAPVKPIDYSGYAGPRYDERGDIISHSLLGTYEDFYREATRRGDMPEDMPVPHGEMERGETPTLKYEKKKRSTHSRQNENNALNNWHRRMMERKRQQGYISKLLQKAPEDLAMNQADNYRTIQEQRYMIDRTIPRVDYGKGYRVGSEFWHQQEQFGDDVTGIHMSLTQTQRGYPPPVEHVGLSQMVKGEKGCEWLGKKNVHVNYPWHKSEFLDRRKRQLEPYMDELDAWKPDFDALQVIGSNKPYRKEEEEETKKYEDAEYDAYLDSFGGQGEIMPFAEDLAEAEQSKEEGGDDVAGEAEKKEPVFGPSLLFGGQAARWTGDSFSFKDEIGIEARVTFEAFTGDRITSYLQLINDGTTSIYYDWKKMAKENPFDLVQKVVQRFYFNNSSGVILPGETLKFPFVFKSPNAGVFTEQWKLETRPVVCGGAALLVTLRGVALQEDKFKAQREQLEKELLQRQAEQVVSQLLFELVSGIRTPERSRSPIDAYVTEEEIFLRNNPGLQYNHELVGNLKDLYGQLFDEDVRAENVWSLSIEDLQESILQLDDDDERQENLLHQMNALVGKLSYIPPEPVQDNLHYVGYELFVEAIDRIVGESLLLRNLMGLPDREQDEIDGEASDSRKGQRGADSKAKADAGKDKAAKGAAKDGRASKASAKPDGKGKATPAPPPKKTPTPVKSTAPTPARVPTPGDKEVADTTGSQPSSPDPNASSMMMSDVELAAAEKLYKDNFTLQVYDILGEMIDKMEQAFSSLKGGSGGLSL